MIASAGRFIFHAGRGDVKLTPDYRLNSLFFGFVDKLGNPEHVAVIRNRSCRHLLLFGLLYHIIDAGRSVKHTELRVGMQMGKMHILSLVKFIFFIDGNEWTVPQTKINLAG